MLPGSSSGDLLYATGGCGGTCVLSYPDGLLVGSIVISGEVEGACSDANGDVFIANDAQVFEYAHGGTYPIATLRLPGDHAYGCAIDSKTGNLAVVFAGTGANVAIFTDAEGTPALYNSHISSIYCGYDSKGNLFVSGYNGAQDAIAELQYGSGDFLLLS
jgi:hypothetical protein